MDFDNPKVYGDTFISDGLVYVGGYRQACSPLIQLFFGFGSDIDQTNINRDIRDGNWLSTPKWKVYEKDCKRPLTFGHKWHTCVWRVGALNIPGQVHPQFQNPQICPPVLRPRLRPPFFGAFTATYV